jgi:glycosyltransferase involved in cell wall biosynthesis
MAREANLAITLIPSSPHRRTNQEVKLAKESLGLAGSTLKIHFLLRVLSLPIWFLDRPYLFDGRIRAWFIARALLRYRPDLVHVMETQNGGYPMSIAASALSQKGYRAPITLLTLFGSDIFWFSRFPRHRRKIALVLSFTDYLALECERDRRLALDLGFKGRFLPVSPVAQGLPLDLVLYSKEFKTVVQRDSIAVKGYSGKWGLGHVAIQALSQSHENLSGLTVEIFSAESGTIRAAKRFLSPRGIKYKVFKKGELNHLEVLALLRRSRLFIGLSRSDGLPSSMLEAMSQGAFPIQTSTACLEGWLVHGKTGYAVSDFSAEAVSQLVDQALSSPDLLSSARLMNLQLIKEKYILSNPSTSRENFYRDISSGK